MPIFDTDAISLESFQPQLSLFDVASITNYQENNGDIKLLRQKDETKNKNEKKITETEIETKTSAFFDAYSNSFVERTRRCYCYTIPWFYLKKSPSNKTMRFLKPDCWPFNTIMTGVVESAAPVIFS